MLLAPIRSIALALLTGAALASVSAGPAAARDCTCRHIGPGVCVPDPSCFDLRAQDMRQGVENAIRNVGSAGEKAVSSSQTGAAPNAEFRKAVDQGVHDAGVAIDRATPSASRLIILATGYSQLAEIGKEETGYGLYSYAILSSHSARSSAFLAEVFKSIPSIEDTPAKRAQLNIFYLPAKKDAADAFADSVKTLGDDAAKLGAKYSDSFYDYKMARAILLHLCNPPVPAMSEVCAGDMSRGPYIFTYAKPASSLEPVRAPLLFADLSDVDPRAFGELVSAFKAQVKREDISDGARINTLRLRLLQIALKAGDLVSPVRKAIGDIIHTAPADKDK
jgi:hypothetical protein